MGRQGGPPLKYRTIVADPPWQERRGTLATPGLLKGWHNHPPALASRPLAYDLMSVAEIANLPVGALAEGDAHLYLWTTNRYLPMAFAVVKAWGFLELRPRLSGRRTRWVEDLRQVGHHH